MHQGVYNVLVDTAKAGRTVTYGQPGPGFFTLAKELKLLSGADQLTFFVEELKRVIDHWQGSGAS